MPVAAAAEALACVETEKTAYLATTRGNAQEGQRGRF
jgi:hypothetical protein